VLVLGCVWLVEVFGWWRCLVGGGARNRRGVMIFMAFMGLLFVAFGISISMIYLVRVRMC